MAVREAVQITGVKEVLRDFEELGRITRQDIKEAHKEAAEPVARQSLTLVPRRSGALAGTIRTVAYSSSGQVRSGSSRVPYAGPIHFGWPARNIRPQPFLYDALDDRRRKVVEVYESYIDSWIRRADLD